MHKQSRICVDARPLIYPSNGNARYLHQMLKELIRLRPDREWILLSHRALHNDYLQLLQMPEVSLNVETGFSGMLGPLWLNLRLPALLREYRAHLFWGTLAMLPLFYSRRSSVPAMVNFHDLNAFVAPETMTPANRWQHRLLDGHTLAHCERILCLSETTRQDILRHFPSLDSRRLEVVYPGATRPTLQTTPPAGGVSRLASFILAVSTLEPRKNFHSLLKGYRNAREKAKDLLPLVLVGRKGWGDSSLYEELKSGRLEREGIYYLENATGAVLQWCYEQAAFLAFPSIHEGFGLPILEARQWKKPLLLSDIPVFREVGGESRFVPPLDVEGWSEGILDYDGLYRSNKLRPAPFDDDFWTWENRAAHLSKIIDTMLGERLV